MMRNMLALIAVAVGAAAAPAAVITKTVEYEFDGVKLKGFVAYDDAATEKRPGVLVVHEWWGLNDYAKERCKKLADLGYVAFAPDMYGEGKTVNHPDDARKMSGMVRENAKVWRGRAEAGLKQLKAQPHVDADKLAAIGYCFGGSTALQLAYSGADLKAVATFHAALAHADRGGGQGDQGAAADLPRRGRLLHPRGEGEGSSVTRSTRPA